MKVGRTEARRAEELEARIEHVHGPEEVEYAPDELVVVCLVRDGRPYLKSFIEHHFSLGARHVVFLDNGSVDGTIEVACSYENVTVLRSDLPFKDYDLFMKRYLVERFGRGRWCLYVDIDELFDYPYSDVIDLGAFLRYLTENSYTAVVAQMLDMFPEDPVLHDARREDEPLKELHRFYDTSDVTTRDYMEELHKFHENLEERARNHQDRHSPHGASNILTNDEIEVYRGGIQEVLFGYRALLTKHPLMFVDEEIVPIDNSSHWVGSARIADVTCVLFHHKFIGDFHERAMLAVREENHSNSSAKYKKYLTTLEQQNRELRIKRETARELTSVDELVDDGFLVISAEYMALVDAKERKDEASQGGPRRLADAFEKAHARARTQAKRTRELERQVQRMERLERRNQDLERQMQSIQASKSWKLLGKLGRVRTRVLGEKG